MAPFDAETADVSGSAVRGSTPPAPDEGAGPMGRYLVVAELGRGAMGRVWRAYDPTLQREVAIKAVRPEALGWGGAARMVDEARAMARLSHPNVVQVFDVEELGAGRVVVVMELVQGRTLQQWLATGSPPWPDVVRAFVGAGRGLAAAHGAGLLHRDFKPANVLIGDDGAVKVTDFGLAKADLAASSLSEGRVVDVHPGDSVSGPALPVTPTLEGMVMGTPRYMPPEQHRGGRLTPASDQYAFCVALWEALCGQTPFPFDLQTGQTTLDPLVLLKEAGPPPWPGGRPGAGVPDAIGRALVRGLAVRTDDRWPSMDALLRELGRTPQVRGRGLVPGWALASGGVLVVSAASWALVPAPVQPCEGGGERLQGAWDDARRDEVRTALGALGPAYVQAVAERAVEDLDDYATAWARAHEDACEATLVRGEQPSEVMDLRMGCLRRARAELVAVTDILADADAEVVERAHDLTSGLPPLPRCSDVEALQTEVEPPLPSERDAVDEVHAHIAAARAATEAGRYETAQSEIATARRLAENLGYGPIQTELAFTHSEVLDKLGDYGAAVVAARRALLAGARWHQRIEMAQAASSLMWLIGGRQQLAEPALWYRKLAAGLAHGEPILEIGLHARMAVILGTQGKYAEAVQEHRRVLALAEASGIPADDPGLLATRSSLATVLDELGRAAEAEQEQRRALALREQALGPDHPQIAESRINLAASLQNQGKNDEAELEIRKAMEVFRAAVGPDHPNVAFCHNNLAALRYAQHDFAGAEVEAREAVAIRRRSLAPDHPDLATALVNLAAILDAREKYEESAAISKEAIGILEARLGENHPQLGAPHNNLANVLQSLGDYAGAAVEHQRAIEIWQGVLDPDHPGLATARTNLANALLQIGRVDEALALAEQAWERRSRPDVPVQARAHGAFILSRVLREAGGAANQRRAIELGEEALRGYEELGRTTGTEPEQIATARRWLASRRRSR